jgi:hypothetical protein
MRGYQKKEIRTMNKLSHVIFPSLFFLTSVFLFGQDEQSYDMLITQINELYEAIEDNEVWEQRTNTLADLFVLFFQTPESLTCDIKTIFPFIHTISSKDNVVRIYSWFKKNGGRAELYDAILQCKLDGKSMIKSVRHNVKYHEVFQLKNNVYLFCGFAGAGAYLGYNDFTVVEINGNRIVSYNAFNNIDSLNFLYVARSPFDDLNYLPRIIDVSYNFENMPFTIKLTYAKPKNFIDETKEVEDNIFSKEFEFIFDGQEFVGDYSLFDPDFTLDIDDDFFLPKGDNRDVQQKDVEYNIIPGMQTTWAEQEGTADQEEDAAAVDQPAAGFPWVIIVVIAGIVVIGGITAFVVLRKKR